MDAHNIDKKCVLQFFGEDLERIILEGMRVIIMELVYTMVCVQLKILLHFF